MLVGTSGAFGLVTAVALTVAPAANGDIVELLDANSAAMIDTGSQAGLFDWSADGIDVAEQSWFWFREGSTGPEQSLDTLDQIGISLTDTNPLVDRRIDTMSVLFQGSGFEVELSYSLRGSTKGTGLSDIAEQIIIRNTGMGSLDLQFFQYADFDLGPDSNDDLEITGGNTARQSNGNMSLFETVVNPTPIAFEAGNVSDLLGSLNDGRATTLSNDATASGNVSWGFQWDLNLTPGGTYIISKTKQITVIPTPGALLLFGLALMTTRGGRRRLA